MDTLERGVGVRKKRPKDALCEKIDLWVFPKQEGDDAPDQVQDRSGPNPTIFYFFQTWSGASC